MIMAQEDAYLCIIVFAYLKECSAGKIMLHKKPKHISLKKADNYNFPEVEENMI